jgi:hypothetical protein
VSLANQAITAVQLARERHPTNFDVQAAADSVEAALRPAGLRDEQVGVEYSACVTITRADASLFDRVVTYRLAGCEAWLARLQATLPALQAALVQAGDDQAAEVVASVGDAVETQEQLSRDLEQPLPAADWWSSLPYPAKVGIGLGAAWLFLDVLGKVGAAKQAFR